MLSKRKPKYSTKNLSSALQAVNNPLENEKRMKLGYMNSRKPSKPNLHSASKPSKLLAPTELHRTLSSLAYQIPQ